VGSVGRGVGGDSGHRCAAAPNASPAASASSTLTPNATNPPTETRRLLEGRALAGRLGAFMLEAVGGDQTVRALVFKGCLRFRERAALAGQMISAYDEHWRPVQVGGLVRSIDARGGAGWG